MVARGLVCGWLGGRAAVGPKGGPWGRQVRTVITAFYTEIMIIDRVLSAPIQAPIQAE